MRKFQIFSNSIRKFHASKIKICPAMRKLWDSKTSRRSKIFCTRLLLPFFYPRKAPLFPQRHFLFESKGDREYSFQKTRLQYTRFQRAYNEPGSAKYRERERKKSRVRVQESWQTIVGAIANRQIPSSNFSREDETIAQ